MWMQQPLTYKKKLGPSSFRIFLWYKIVTHRQFWIWWDSSSILFDNVWNIRLLWFINNKIERYRMEPNSKLSRNIWCKRASINNIDRILRILGPPLPFVCDPLSLACQRRVCMAHNESHKQPHKYSCYFFLLKFKDYCANAFNQLRNSIALALSESEKIISEILNLLPILGSAIDPLNVEHLWPPGMPQVNVLASNCLDGKTSKILLNFRYFFFVEHFGCLVISSIV